MCAVGGVVAVAAKSIPDAHRRARLAPGLLPSRPPRMTMLGPVDRGHDETDNDVRTPLVDNVAGGRLHRAVRPSL
jgi:hypothetical protein|eukprot:1685987-Prymnesium_polylepis.1